MTECITRNHSVPKCCAFIQVSGNGTWCSVISTTKHLQSKRMPYLDLLNTVLCYLCMGWVWL